MKKYLLMSTAIVFTLGIAGAALAETTTTTTTHTISETPGVATTIEKTTTESTPTSETTSTSSVTTTQPAVTRTEMHWSTHETTIPTGSRVLYFPDFDVNKDSILSLNEIGEMLFKLYDTDGNEIIDNNEYERRAVVTVMPMEKETTISYDFDGDGMADKVQRTQETFMRDTMLTKFDTNKDGLSPHEFAGIGFLEADVNDDKAIELKEWQGTYISSIDKVNRRDEKMNNKK